jgi:hypothetical protein
MDMEAQQEKEAEKQRVMDWVHQQPPEMQNFLAVNPEAGAKMWQEQKIKQMYADPVDPTDDMREYDKALRQGYKGTLQDWIVTGKKAGAPQTTIDLRGDNAYSKTRGEGFAKRADDIDSAEQSAFKTINSLNQMDQLIEDPSFYSGFGADQLQAVKKMAVALGGDPNSVNSMEQFNTLSKQSALDTMGGSLGTGFSNADRDFVVGQVPNLQNTPQGNKTIIAINRKMQERKIEIAKMARAYEIKTGRLDAGFMQELSTWAEAHPLFTGMPPSNAGRAPTGTGRDGKTSNGVPWKVLQ